jgi:hypothetical protein
VGVHGHCSNRDRGFKPPGALPHPSRGRSHYGMSIRLRAPVVKEETVRETYTYTCNLCGGIGKRVNDYRLVNPTAPPEIPCWACGGRGECEFADNGKWRKARIAHACWQCKAPIAPGDAYWEDFNEDPAFQSGTPYCPSCVEDPASGSYGLATPRDPVRGRGGGA